MKIRLISQYWYHKRLLNELEEKKEQLNLKKTDARKIQ